MADEYLGQRINESPRLDNVILGTEMIPIGRAW